VARLDLVPGGWRDVEGAEADLPGADVLAVAGIAGPEVFARLVRGMTGSDPELMAFPDHHDYDASDAERILRAAGPRTVVTTEKDAVKLAGLRHLLPPLRVMRLEARGGPDAERILARVASVAGGGAPAPAADREKNP
jgi:tetraacyldisaccharide-1-P 4'-kinase